MARRPATALAAAFACLGALVVTWGLTFGLASTGFIIGGLGLVFGSWTVFWIGGALLIVALIATVVLQKMGMGAV